MKVCKKVFLPLLAGFLAGALTTSLSVFLFVNRFFLAPEGMKDIFENDALSLTGMMIFTSSLIKRSSCLTSYSTSTGKSMVITTCWIMTKEM